jgi:hypothetical protein
MEIGVPKIGPPEGLALADETEKRIGTKMPATTSELRVAFTKSFSHLSLPLTSKDCHWANEENRIRTGWEPLNS